MFRDFDYENKPVVDIVNEMIMDAISKNASDIHFDPTENELNVRIRIDGELLEYAKVPNFVKKNLLTRIKIIAGMNITETRLPQDGAIKNLTDTNDLDLRVSSLPIVDGEKIVIRILNYTMSTSGLENLGLSENNLEKIYKLLRIPNGIILVSGATGTGKSTTVYAMLQILNTVSRNIITVEDPVEMKITGINQVQVMADIGLTFGNTLRSILRQDPDVIMIGEIRDDETARIAVRASITGHLVLSTIHTNNSLNTIERLLDMEVERYLLGSAITGIISQRLVKRLCPKCRTSRPTTNFEKILFEKVLGQQVDTIYAPKGCDACINGYTGRIALHEVLIISQEIRDAITNNIRKNKLRHLVYDRSDVTSLLKDGLEKVVAGLTSIDEILRVIDVDDDIGEDEDDLKAAFMGKIDTPAQVTSSPAPTTEELIDQPIENIPPVTEELIEPVMPTTNNPVETIEQIPATQEFIEEPTMLDPNITQNQEFTEQPTIEEINTPEMTNIDDSVQTSEQNLIETPQVNQEFITPPFIDQLSNPEVTNLNNTEPILEQYVEQPQVEQTINPEIPNLNDFPQPEQFTIDTKPNEFYNSEVIEQPNMEGTIPDLTNNNLEQPIDNQYPQENVAETL